MRSRFRWLAMIVIMVMLGGCGPLSMAQAEPELRFEITLGVNAEHEFQATLGVRNAGDGAFEGDSSFNGEMEMRRVPSGELRASAHTVPLEPLDPGQVVWPVTWRAQLAAGTYELIWGAKGYGSTRQKFDIVDEDGQITFRGERLATPEPDSTAAER